MLGLHLGDETLDGEGEGKGGEVRERGNRMVLSWALTMSHRGTAGGSAGAAVQVSGQMPPRVSAWEHVGGRDFSSRLLPLLSPAGHCLLSSELQAESQEDRHKALGVDSRGSRVMEGGPDG